MAGLSGSFAGLRHRNLRVAVALLTLTSRPVRDLRRVPAAQPVTTTLAG